VPMVGIGITGVKVDRALKFPLQRGPIIIVREGDSPEGSVRIRECVGFPNRQPSGHSPTREKSYALHW
jgi:hypothetical protein